MSLKEWEAKVLAEPAARQRVREIEDELRLAAGLTALREQAGLSQRELARRVGVSQPRIAKIERSQNVTIDLLEQYVEALGARLEVSVVIGRRKTALIGDRSRRRKTSVRAEQKTSEATGQTTKARKRTNTQPRKAKKATANA